jgi:diguanylate cyclase (GGDEF)-like protein
MTQNLRAQDVEICPDDKTYQQITHRMVSVDQLTGLANRNAIYSDFADFYSSASTLELALIDLDRFKDINDGFGHYIGDQVLVEVGGMLDEIARGHQCQAYRLAGDEFVLIATGQNIELACRQLMAMGNTPVVVEGRYLSIGLSVGVAHAMQDGNTIEELIKCADAALRQAKQKGGGRIERFSARLLPYVETKALLSTQLEDALDRHELSYSFQPIFDLKHGVIIGYEALARWQRDGRSIPPDIFISLAEETGHIHRIQEYLFEYLAGCLDVLGDAAYLALNISPSQLASDRLYARLKRFLEETGFSPARLELELTERSLLLIGEEVIGRLERLKELGVKLSLDDFGTGYSCLSYLKDLPIDKMKIDRSFVINIDHDPKGLTVVTAVIDLAKKLGMTIVAEGVEQSSQAYLLQKMGCRYGQGYLYSKPLTVTEMRDVIYSVKHRP